MAEEKIDVSQVIEISAKNIVNVIRNNQEKIKEYAENILKKARELQIITENFSQLQKVYTEKNRHIKNLKKAVKDKKETDESIKNEVDLYEEAKKTIKALGVIETSALFKKDITNIINGLQEEIHSFQEFFGGKFGQTFVLQYVVYNRGKPRIFQIPFEKAIQVQYEGISHGFVNRINFSLSQIQKKIAEGEAIKEINIEKEVDITENQKAIIDHIYSLAYSRYQKTKEKIIWAELQGKRVKFAVNNRGDLAEGYLRFLYHIRSFSGANDEEKLIEFITKGVVPVTNQSGFFLEDIAFKNKQIAAKFGSAQAMQSKQIVELAKQILNLLNNKLSEEEMIKYLEDQSFFSGSQRNGLITEIEEGAKLYSQTEINTYLKEIKA